MKGEEKRGRGLCFLPLSLLPDLMTLHRPKQPPLSALSPPHPQSKTFWFRNPCYMLTLLQMSHNCVIVHKRNRIMETYQHTWLCSPSSVLYIPADALSIDCDLSCLSLVCCVSWCGVVWGGGCITSPLNTDLKAPGIVAVLSVCCWKKCNMK